MKTGLIAAALLALSATSALAQQRYVGEVFVFASNFCPKGSLPAGGQLLGISGNEDLYSIIGTVYGGDGETAFALPAIPPGLTREDGPFMIYCIQTRGTVPERP